MSRERCSFFLSFLSFCSKKKGGLDCPMSLTRDNVLWELELSDWT